MTTPDSLPSPTPNDGTDKTLSILCHCSIFIGVGLLLPLIVYLMKKQESPALAEQAREALNFHISLVIYIFVAILLCFIVVGFVLLPIIGIGAAILAILASIKASEGVVYKYPLTLRLVS